MVFVDSVSPKASGYANPPVVQAALEVSFTSPENGIVELLPELRQKLADAFPQFRDRTLNQASASNEASISSSSELNGTQLRSVERSQLAEIGPEGVTVTQVGHYQGWDELRTAATRCIDACAELLPEANFDQLSLRYINQIAVPVPCELSQFLQIYPQTPNDLEFGTFGDFNTQLEFVGKDHRYGITIRQGVLPNISEAKGALLLDIEVYTRDLRSQRLTKSDEETDTLWPTFSEMRALKNIVFEQSITDETRRLFR